DRGNLVLAHPRFDRIAKQLALDLDRRAQAAFDALDARRDRHRRWWLDRRARRGSARSDERATDDRTSHGSARTGSLHWTRVPHEAPDPRVAQPVDSVQRPVFSRTVRSSDSALAVAMSGLPSLL